MLPEQNPSFDEEFLTAIAERPNEIMKCAMYLFLGYLYGAARFAQSCRDDSNDISLPWSRKEDEDDRHFAYRCMMQAHRMMKSTQPKRGVYVKIWNRKSLKFNNIIVTLHIQHFKPLPCGAYIFVVPNT